MNGEPSSLQGLDQAEAALRLARDGTNELPGMGPRGLLPILREILTEPMFLLLIAAATIYAVLGETQDALVLCSSLVVVVLITVLQERRTEQALAKLRDLSSPRALVIRGGVEHRIPGREVVIGDILLLREGDRVPADGMVRSATALSIDESILTGESLPTDKSATPAGSQDRSSQVFSGTLVVRGYGVAEVTATGPRSELGRIGQALKDLTPEVTSMFREVRRVVRWVATAGVLLCVVVAVLYAATRHDWLGGVLAGITLAMGVLPEEFPVVLTVFLAMGAWRISRANVLTRRMPAVETIGAVTVLAVDKTGTLTENRMRLALVQTMHRTFDLRRGPADLDADADAILRSALAASEQDAFDPMERAIQEGAARHAPSSTDVAGMTLVREYDLTPELLAVTHVWRRPAAAGLEVHVKGAPETVIDLCGVQKVHREQLLAQVAAHANGGMRVLGVARGDHPEAGLPESARGFRLQLLGFVCLSDPLRPDVPAALAECVQAGIRVVMITGDHPGTALAIAMQAGFDTSGGAMTGAELTALDDGQLRERVRQVNVYARARPEHKLRLVQAFKANGEVIAMTGDGVNDAPALKAANVGVAMGERGTDVAREAASLVLVKDDFNSLVVAVRLGRRVYENIGHAMAYIVSVHIPVAGLGLLPVLMDWPLLFFPMHVLFLEFVVDPACALVFEADPENPDTMRRPPRRRDAALFPAAVIRRSVLLGIVPLLVGTLVYGIALRMGTVDQARTVAFVAVLAGNLALIFVSRSNSASLLGILRRPNHTFWWITGLALLALAATICVPGIARAFHFGRVPFAMVGMVFSLTVAAVLLSGIALRRPAYQGRSAP